MIEHIRKFFLIPFAALIAALLGLLISSTSASGENLSPDFQKFRMNAKELRVWLDNNPEVQRLRSLPKSPERDLFESLTQHTLHFLDQDPDHSLVFGGDTPKGQLFGMMFGMTDQIMSSPPRNQSAHPFPDYLGLIMQSQFIAIDYSGAQLQPLVFNRMMAGMRFMLQAMASGHHSLKEIQELAQKTDITIVNEINGRKIENKFKATEALRILESVGLKISNDQNTIAPHWRHWASFNYRPLEGSPEISMTPRGIMNVVKTRQPLGVFHLLEEQLASKLIPESLADWKRTWILNARDRMDWSRFKWAENLTEDQRLTVVESVIATREPNPTKFTKAVTSQLSSLSFLPLKGMTTKDLKNLWLEVLNASYGSIYQLQATKEQAEKSFVAEQEAAAKRLREEAENRELRSKADAFANRLMISLHDLDPITSYADYHASFLTHMMRDAIAERRMAIPSAETIDTIPKIVSLMRETILKESDRNPILSAHLQELEKIAELHLGRPLEPKEKALLLEAQSEVLSQRVLQMTSQTSEMQLPTSVRTTLGHLGLLNSGTQDPFRLYQIPHLRSREEEPVTKTLKRSAARSLNLSPTEDIVKIAEHIVKRLNLDEAMIHADISDEPTENLSLSQIRHELKRAMIVMIHKNPKDAAELQSLLMNNKLLTTMTGEPHRIPLSSASANELFSQTITILHSLSYALDCRKLFRELATSPAAR